MSKCCRLVKIIIKTSQDTSLMVFRPVRKIMSPLSNRFGRDVLWNVGSLAVLGVSGIVINCVIMVFAGIEALGIFNQVFAFFIVASQFAVGGLQTSALKHCSYVQDDPAECEKIASSAMMLTAALSGVVCLVLFYASPFAGRVLQSPQVALGIRFAVPGLFLFALNKVMLMVLNGMRNMRAFAVFQALRYIFIMLGATGILILGYPGSHLALSLTIAETALFAGLFAYINIKLFVFKFSLAKDMRDWFARHISFGTRGFMSGALVELNTRVDVLMLGIFMSDAFVGIYSFASTFAEGFAMLNSVLRQNTDPVIGKYFASGAKEKIQQTSKRIRKLFFPLMFVGGGILVAMFPMIIKLFSSDPDMWMGWGVFAILVSGTVIASGYRPFMGIILLGGRPGTYTLLLGASVLGNVALNVLLIPLLGIYGAATATAAIYVVEAIAVVILSRRLFNVSL